MKQDFSLRRVLLISCLIAVAAGADGIARADGAAAGDDAGKYAGVFESERITIELKPAGPGQLTGTITLGSKQFPASGKVADGRLVGTFESGGAKFDFTASVEGPAMHFVSGKTDLNLARKVNALQGPPAAANPLDAAQPGDKPAQPAMAAPADAQIFRREVLFDPFAQDNAFTVLVPEGWKMQGHANWNLASARIVDIDVNVFDPKTGAALIMYPRLVYVDDPIGRKQQYQRLLPQVGPARAKEMSEQNEGKEFTLGQPVRHQVASPAEYVRLFTMPEYRKGINVNECKFSDEIDLPEMAKAAVKTAHDFWVRTRPPGAAAMPDAEAHASRMRVTYTSPQGQSFDEQFTCLLTSQFLPSDVGHGSYIWHADVWSCRAPVGQLDRLLPLFATVKSSFAYTFNWDNFRFQCQALSLQAKIDAHLRDTEIMRKAAQEKAQIEADARRKQFAEQMAAKDEAQHQEMNYIQDKRDYVNRGDNSVYTLPSGYRYQWLSSDGEVISTDDARFNPRGSSPSTSWNLLEPK